MKIALLGVLSTLSLMAFPRPSLAADAQANAPIEAPVSPAIQLPTPVLETLPNGLTVAWFLNDSLPVVDVGMLVKSGSRDDAPGKSGTAELLSRTLDRGAGGMSAQQIARATDHLGATRAISASSDYFSIGLHGLAPDADALLDLLAKMSLQPDFPEAEVKREHEKVVDSWKHIADYGEALVGLAFSRILRSGTSYGRGDIQSVEEFKKVGRADLVAFHKKHFVPKNAILMVVGRVKQAEFRQKILVRFGDWRAPSGADLPVREWRNYVNPRFARSKKPEIWIVDRPSLTQAQVRIGFRAPLIHAPEHYPLVVANALLGEYFHSRLNTLIRDKLGLTYGIGSSFSYDKDLAIFAVGAATRNEATGQLVSKSLEVLKELKKGPVPQEEVQMAKDYLLGGFPLATSTLSSVASRWLSGYVFELGANYLNEFVPKVSAVQSPEILRAMSTGFDLDQLVIVVAGDAREIEKSLAPFKLGQVRRLSPRDLM